MSDKEIDYVVKEGHTIQHDTVTYNAGDQLKLTKEQATKLHVETAEQAKARAVLAGKDSYGSSEADTPKPNTKALLAKIKDAQSIETVKALMSLSETATVKTAGERRIKVIEQSEAEAKNVPVTKDSLLEDIGNASTVEELKALDDKITGSEITYADLKVVMDAQAARKTELEG